jgi:hypothetical protein
VLSNFKKDVRAGGQKQMSFGGILIHEFCDDHAFARAGGLNDADPVFLLK